MSLDGFQSLSPSEQLRHLQELERAQSAERAVDFGDLVEVFRQRLGTLSSSVIVLLLAQAVDDPATEDQEVYWCCVSELHRRVDPETFEACAAWAASAEPSSRKASADVLSQLGYAKGYPFAGQSRAILERLLEDSNPSVVRAALIALGHLRIGELSLIAGFANHPSMEVRGAVVHALLQRDEPLARRTLCELSRDGATEVRDWATFALGTGSEVDSPEIRAALAARLVDEDDETRGEALMGLAERKDPRVIPALVGEFARVDVCALAIRAATQMPHESLLPGLETLLRASPDDPDVIEAIAACRSSTLRGARP